VVFFFGVFMKRLNAKGCLSALVVGFALGIFRLAVDTPLTLDLNGFEGYAEGSFLWIISNIYFQYYSLLICLVCAAVAVGVSYATEAPDPEQLEGLTYATVSQEDKAESRESWGWVEVAWSGVVLASILAAYLFFTG
jgi:SSS family solute:Na+ symporter